MVLYHLARKLRLIAARKKLAPRWAELRKFGKRARTRRIRIAVKHWRRSKLKR